MAFYINTTRIIDNSREIIPGKFSTRANLPTGTSGYLAYVSDQNELVSNTGEAQQSGTAPTEADAGITWYKFLTKPMDYKNEVILAQGTVAGGWIGNGALYRISQVLYSTDVVNFLSQALPFTTAGGGSHSTDTHAYYHQGNVTGSFGNYGTEKKSAKHSWATYSVVSLTDRPNSFGGWLISTQPGPKTQNTKGVLLQGGQGYGCHIIFATDSWVSIGGVNVANGNAIGFSPFHGWGLYSSNYGYVNDGYTGYGTSQNVRIAWATDTWRSDVRRSPSATVDTASAGLNSKWDKFYSSAGSSTLIDRYNEPALSWSAAVASVPGISEGMRNPSSLMGQDWGYWIGFYSGGAYYASSYQHHYPTETVSLVPSITTVNYIFSGSLPGGASAASSCTGPIV